VAYESSSDLPATIEKSYGEITASQKIWGEKDDAGNIKPTYFKPLEIAKCNID